MLPSAADKRKARTVEKALTVLAEFAKGPPIIGVQALSVRTGFPPAVVQRLVNALRASGFMEQNELNKKYQLGVRVLELGAAAARHSKLLSAAKPVMHELNEVTRELVFLDVVDRQNWRVSYIHFLDPLENRPLKLVQHSYLHAGAAGKVLLASLSPREVDYVLTKIGLPRLTARTITRPRLLRKELDRIRRDGYAVSHGEVVDGTSGVAAPIRDSGGDVIASLCVSAHDSRVNEDKLAEFKRLVVIGAARVSAVLGGPREVAQTKQRGKARNRLVQKGYLKRLPVGGER